MNLFVDDLLRVHADVRRVMVLAVLSNGLHMKDAAVAILEQRFDTSLLLLFAITIFNSIKM